MRKFLAAAAIMSLATGSFAGSLADPVVEPTLITEDVTGSSSGASHVGLLAIVLMAVAVDK